MSRWHHTVRWLLWLLLAADRRRVPRFADMAAIDDPDWLEREHHRRRLEYIEQELQVFKRGPV
jgi:hypothetical protein